MPARRSGCSGVPDLEACQLQCPVPEGASSPLEHNCSGKHAAFLATCRQMHWPFESYLRQDHPLQQEVVRRVGELLGIPAAELVSATDDCGAPTLQLRLAQMALLMAHLGSGEQPDLERLSRAMLAHPDLVAGEERFDTLLMRCCPWSGDQQGRRRGDPEPLPGGGGDGCGHQGG